DYVGTSNRISRRISVRTTESIDILPNLTYQYRVPNLKTTICLTKVSRFASSR
ncbi:6122_t:CDS:2, partial [Gigaspora rosea]